MARTPHPEYHFTSGNFVRDMVIGMSDGLTVPFALAAGLSGAVANTRLIVIGGLAEIAAGSIAMGLGGYLAAQGDAEHYEQERAREYREVEEIPEQEKAEVSYVFQEYGLTAEQSKPIVDALSKRTDAWVDFMMRFELGLEAPDPKRAVTSAATIAGAYIAGGLIPLSPYILLGNAFRGLISFGDRYPGSFGHFRIHQRQIHRSAGGAECVSNGDHWRTGSGSGIPVGQADRLDSAGGFQFVCRDAGILPYKFQSF